LNPVRAEMVTHASGYPWSSYQSNALGKPIQLLTPHLHIQPPVLSLEIQG
jgi:putative transposase